MVACNRQTSVYPPVDFRKPSDGTAPVVIPASQGSKYDSAVVHFFHPSFSSFLLALFSCFPVRTCTNFLFSGFKTTENVFSRSDASDLYHQHLIAQPASELAQYGKTLLETRNVHKTDPVGGPFLSCVVTNLAWSLGGTLRSLPVTSTPLLGHLPSGLRPLSLRGFSLFFGVFPFFLMVLG